MKVLSLLAAITAAAALQPYSANAQEKACKAENGVLYNPQKLFDPEYECYPAQPTDCPDAGTVCANHALVKLANYEGDGKTPNDYQDLIYSPHRGLWGQAYGSVDPAFKTPPAQNTNQAFDLVTSFVTRHPVNFDDVNYGAFLRGRLVELDITVSGDDVPGRAQDVLVDHYVTTANTVQGDLNTYLASMSRQAIAASNAKLENRDFSASPMALSETPVASVTRKAIVDSADPRFGLIAYHDIKTRRGDIQCQTSMIAKGTPQYERYHCQFNEPDVAEQEQFNAQIRSADEMYSAKGGKNVVIKTTATFSEMLASIMIYYRVSHEGGLEIMKRYMWQPHPKGAGGAGAYVQYIHEWLVSVPRSVQAWEMNIYYTEDATNLPFCVTRYTGPGQEHPLGHVETKRVRSVTDKAGCRYGPYYNMLDYLRQNTGNPKYFGFPPEVLAEGPISGNRANLWLLDTASAAGTSDREYRWQILGSDAKYNMSDPIRYLAYPYVAYQILNADRLDTVKQAIDGGMYQKWGQNGPVTPALAPTAVVRNMAITDADRMAADARFEEDQ